MDTIISVQDIRTSLGSISKRVEAGETFTVVRNSKPAFRIVPVERLGPVKEEGPAYQVGRRVNRSTIPTLEEIHRSFEETGANKMITPEELDQLIHEVHQERNQRLREQQRRED